MPLEKGFHFKPSELGLSMDSHLDEAFCVVSELAHFTMQVQFHLLLDPTMRRLWEQTNDAVQSRHKEMLRKDLRLLRMLQNKIEEVIKKTTEVLDTWNSHGMNSFLSQ